MEVGQEQEVVKRKKRGRMRTEISYRFCDQESGDIMVGDGITPARREISAVRREIDPNTKNALFAGRYAPLTSTLIITKEHILFLDRPDPDYVEKWIP